jgi:hypothetical protein
MIVSINQPAYLPWLGYFDRIAHSDIHVVLDHVQFEKNSYVNRNQILSPNGPAWLTVPVRTKGRFGNLDIKSLEIDRSQHWQRKHLRTIEGAYANTPMFNQFWEPIRNIIDHDWIYLAELCDSINLHLLSQFDINTKITRSTELNCAETKSDLVLEICRKLGADTYLSGPFGRDYLDVDAFQNAGIGIQFHDFASPTYPQPTEPFVPNLSVVDCLFRAGVPTVPISTI